MEEGLRNRIVEGCDVLEVVARRIGAGGGGQMWSSTVRACASFAMTDLRCAFKGLV
jgi:hypothetical protein